MKLSKFTIFINTLNFALCFIGYQLATSIFLPLSSDLDGISRTVTVPYRAFSLLVALLVILLNIRNKTEKTHPALKVFWIFWIALIIRIFYDTNIRTDFYIKDTSQLWLYIFGIILPAMLSVMKSYKHIDFGKALIWIYLGTILTLILSLFNNTSLLMDADEITGRVSGNVALNTISFGHLGTMGVILSLFIFSQYKINILKKLLIIGVILVSFFIMIRSGSRSPILALIIVLLFWLFARGKNIVLGVTITLIAFLLLIVFIDPILNFMGSISPVLEVRLRVGLYEGDSSGRDLLYKEALQHFLDRPILGKQFALLNNFGSFIYSHNILTDSLMALGLFGGLAIIYVLWIALRKSYFLIKRRDPLFWITLILIQQIVMSMLSGAIYYNQLLNILLVVILVENSPTTENRIRKII